MFQLHRLTARALCALTLAIAPIVTATADTAEESAKIAEAKKLYVQALPMPVDSPEKAQLLDQSADILHKVIEKNPQSLEAHRKLMGVYLLKQDYTNGIRTLQDAITLSPEDPKLFITLAFLYEHSGAFEYAKAMLNQALALDPDDKLAQEYRVAIQQKIDARNMEEMHDGKNPIGESHGKPLHDSVHKK